MGVFGRRIGGLTLLELVGDATWFAQTAGRTGLVVEIPTRRSNADDITRSTHRDLQAVRSIADPRIVVGDVVRVRRGALHIVTGIPEGYGPLASTLAALNEQDRIRIVNDLAEALTVVHQHRCVHGALGIGAVLVSKESALLAGFGCRNLTSVVRETRRDRPSTLVSAPTAPELRGGAAASFATDVFAFGALVEAVLGDLALAPEWNIWINRLRSPSAADRPSTPRLPHGLRPTTRREASLFQPTSITTAPFANSDDIAPVDVYLGVDGPADPDCEVSVDGASGARAVGFGTRQALGVGAASALRPMTLVATMLGAARQRWAMIPAAQWSRAAIGAAFVATVVAVPFIAGSRSSESPALRVRGVSSSSNPRGGASSSSELQHGGGPAVNLTTSTSRRRLTTTATTATSGSIQTGADDGSVPSVPDDPQPSPTWPATSVALPGTVGSPTTHRPSSTTRHSTTSTVPAPTTTTFTPGPIWSGTVFGDTNIWYAGSGGGCPIPTYRHGKAPSTSLTVRPGQVLTFTATGSVQTDPTAPFNGPDGGHGGVGYTGSNLAAENGLSGVYVNATGFLGGAFVGTGGAGSQYANGMFFTSLAPQLNQVFYVGNGKAANVYQQFTVPSGATRLVLGIPDGLKGKGCPGFYSDNRGWFNVTVARIA